MSKLYKFGVISLFLIGLVYSLMYYFQVSIRMDDLSYKENIVNVNNETDESFLCSDGQRSYFIVNESLAADLLNGHEIYELAYNYKTLPSSSGLLDTVSVCLRIRKD